MIDLTNMKEVPNKFGGSEKKKTVIYDNRCYLIKFPDPARGKTRKSMRYINNQYSEYIGCKIFKEIGFDVQNTFLALYNDANTAKVVVACEDFTQDGAVLSEFSKLNLSLTESDTRAVISFEAVQDFIEKNDLIINKKEIIDKFWDMFVVDTLIGNTDRHYDNWGVLTKPDGSVSFSPIYDCGSSLGCLLSDDFMEKNINSLEFKNLEFNVCSVYSYKGKRVFYHNIYKDMPKGLANALLRIYPKIKIDNINKIIEDTEGLSNIRKEYIKKSIACRYNEILRSAYKKICKEINFCR